MAAWKRFVFKGKARVWVLVDAQGQPAEEQGRVTIAYKPGDSKTYTGRLENLGAPAGNEVLQQAQWEEAAATQAAIPKKPRKKAAPKEEPSEAATDADVKGASGKKKRDSVKIYTDGACSGNPGPAAAAALLRYQGKEKELSRYLGLATNNIAELTAVQIALEAIKDRSLPVDLHTDSTYVIGVLTLGWSAKANQELIAAIRRLIATFSDLRFIKVKGHAGVADNERVDELARQAMEGRK
jgi:ribonuclease HI